MDATAVLDHQKSFATEKLFVSEKCNATTTLLRNVVKVMLQQLLPKTEYIFKLTFVCVCNIYLFIYFRNIIEDVSNSILGCIFYHLDWLSQ